MRLATCAELDEGTRQRNSIASDFQKERLTSRTLSSLPRIAGLEFSPVRLFFSRILLISQAMNHTNHPRLLMALISTLFSFIAPSAFADPIDLGTDAPALTVTTHEGLPLKTGEAFGSGFALVYFYPKADTPGCTAQACSLRDAYETLQESGVSIFGVSRDTVAAQKAFQDKYKLPFTLIADESGELVEAFGVPARGKFASRQAFLFKDGKLIWRDLSASTKEQAADVLAELAKQQPGFLGEESARDELGITVSYWESLEAMKEWKQNIDHLQAQKLGKEKWYKKYKLRVVHVVRDAEFGF